MTALLPWERLGSKVCDRHLERLAVVYVRQSTRQQVIDHGESTRLQYGLVERAVGLGWQASRVLVIDEDLGKSGASAVGRVGFQRLVTEITMGHVGLVLGIEMSRLARSGADWYQLLELCALSGALLADVDGIYDPVDYNDRLLLGLKGTMSEAELHLLKQRMLAGKQAKARRGELAIPLPTGYVRRPSGEAALDPEEQVQTVVRLIFAKFAELGTLHGVLRWLVEIPGVLPAYITVEQYQANLARLAANAARAEQPGVVRAGSALLSGLARCGRCGRRMTVRYHLRGQTTAPEYVCARQLTDYGAGERCQALAGACVDALVTQQVLAALAPAAVEVSLQAAQQVTAERAAPTTTDADRKQIIRALVDQVTITVVGTSERVAVEIGWAGGHATHADAVRPVARLEQLSCYPQLVERVRQLAEQGYRAKAIANRLHAEGFRPAKGHNRIGVSAIKQLLRDLGCPPAVTRARIAPPPGEAPGPHEWWLDELAAELAMPPITLHSWIRRGWVSARQESHRPYRWILHADSDQLAELRQRRTRPPGWYTRRRWTDSLPPDHNGAEDHAASPHI